MKTYLNTTEENKKVKITVTYDKGGINMFTHKQTQRGYYLAAQPIEIKQYENGINIESFTAFSGVRKCILEVKRQSDKGYNEALKMYENSINELLEYITTKNDIIIEIS